MTRCDFTRRLEEDAAAAPRSSLTDSSASLSRRQVAETSLGGMEPAGAYGAGKAGSLAFDPVAFFTHPRTVLRLLSWVSLHRIESVFIINGRACAVYLHRLLLSASLPFTAFMCLCLSLFFCRCLLSSQVGLIHFSFYERRDRREAVSSSDSSEQHRLHVSDAAPGWSSMQDQQRLITICLSGASLCLG